MIKALIVLHCSFITSLWADELGKGVYFINEGNFMITTSKWTVVVDFTFEDLTRQLSLLLKHHQLLDDSLRKMNSLMMCQRDDLEAICKVIHEEVFHLKTLLNESIREYHDLRSSLMIVRTKRFLMGFVGVLFNFLFGGATEKDIEALNGKVNEIASKQQSIVHELKLQATVLKQTIPVVESNSKNIEKLYNAQEKMLKNVHEQGVLLYVNSVLRCAASFQGYFKSSLNSIRGATNVLSQGKLSSYLLPPEVLLRILRDIESTLPRGYNFVDRVHQSNLMKFYKWTKVTSVALPNKFRIFVEFPLLTTSGSYDLYEILKFPSYFEKADVYSYYDTHYPYIAISSDRQSYLLLEEHDVSQCKQHSIPLCAPRLGIFRASQNSCEYALFMGLEVEIEKYCEKRLVETPMPLFKRVNREGRWMYSIPKSIPLIIDCSRSPTPDDSARMILNRTGFIEMPMACTGHASGIELHSYFHSPSFVRMPNKTFIVPPVSDILKDAELDLVRESFRKSKEKLFPKFKDDAALPLEVASVSLSKIRSHIDKLNKDNVVRENIRPKEKLLPKFQDDAASGALQAASVSLNHVRSRKEFLKNGNEGQGSTPTSFIILGVVSALIIIILVGITVFSFRRHHMRIPPGKGWEIQTND